MLDFIVNGKGHGDVAAKLLAADFRPEVLRPYIGKNRGTYIDMSTNVRDPKTKQPKFKTIRVNSPATLLKDEWKQMDEAVIGVQRDRALPDQRATGFDVDDRPGHPLLDHAVRRELLAEGRYRLLALAHDPADVFRSGAEGSGDDIVKLQ